MTLDTGKFVGIFWFWIKFSHRNDIFSYGFICKKKFKSEN